MIAMLEARERAQVRLEHDSKITGVRIQALRRALQSLTAEKPEQGKLFRFPAPTYKGQEAPKSSYSQQ